MSGGEWWGSCMCKKGEELKVEKTEIEDPYEGQTV